MRTGVVTGLMASLLLGCATLPDSSDSGISDSGIVVSGRVTATGSDPHVILVLDTDTEHYQLVGEQVAELWGLQQRRIKVYGRVVRQALGPGFPAQLEVDDFQVVKGQH